MSARHCFRYGPHPDNSKIVRVAYYRDWSYGYREIVRVDHYIDPQPRWHTRRRFGAV